MKKELIKLTLMLIPTVCWFIACIVSLVTTSIAWDVICFSSFLLTLFFVGLFATFEDESDEAIQEQKKMERKKSSDENFWTYVGGFTFLGITCVSGSRMFHMFLSLSDLETGFMIIASILFFCLLGFSLNNVSRKIRKETSRTPANEN